MASWFKMSLLQNEPLAKLRARCKVRMLIFDFLSGSPKQLSEDREQADSIQLTAFMQLFNLTLRQTHCFAQLCP